MNPNPYDAPPPSPEKFGQTPAEKGPPTKDNLTMAMLAHLLGGLLGFLGPLIIWLVKKDDHPFVDDQGKEALNFQLFLLIGYLLMTTLWIVISFVTCGIGAMLPLPLIVYVFQVVFGILGAVAANKGEWYRYPVTIRFIK